MGFFDSTRKETSKAGLQGYIKSSNAAAGSYGAMLTDAGKAVADYAAVTSEERQAEANKQAMLASRNTDYGRSKVDQALLKKAQEGQAQKATNVGEWGNIVKDVQFDTEGNAIGDITPMQASALKLIKNANSNPTTPAMDDINAKIANYRSNAIAGGDTATQKYIQQQQDTATQRAIENRRADARFIWQQNAEADKQSIREDKTKLRGINTNGGYRNTLADRLSDIAKERGKGFTGKLDTIEQADAWLEKNGLSEYAAGGKVGDAINDNQQIVNIENARARYAQEISGLDLDMQTKAMAAFDKANPIKKTKSNTAMKELNKKMMNDEIEALKMQMKGTFNKDGYITKRTRKAWTPKDTATVAVADINAKYGQKSWVPFTSNNLNEVMQNPTIAAAFSDGVLTSNDIEKVVKENVGSGMFDSIGISSTEKALKSVIGEKEALKKALADLPKASKKMTAKQYEAAKNKVYATYLRNSSLNASKKVDAVDENKWANSIIAKNNLVGSVKKLKDAKDFNTKGDTTDDKKVEGDKKIEDTKKLKGDKKTVVEVEKLKLPTNIKEGIAYRKRIAEIIRSRQKVIGYNSVGEPQYGMRGSIEVEDSKVTGQEEPSTKYNDRGELVGPMYGPKVSKEAGEAIRNAVMKYNKGTPTKGYTTPEFISTKPVQNVGNVLPTISSGSTAPGYWDKAPVDTMSIADKLMEGSAYARQNEYSNGKNAFTPIKNEAMQREKTYTGLMKAAKDPEAVSAVVEGASKILGTTMTMQAIVGYLNSFTEATATAAEKERHAKLEKLVRQVELETDTRRNFNMY